MWRRSNLQQITFFPIITSEWHLQPLLHVNSVTQSVLSAVNDGGNQTAAVLNTLRLLLFSQWFYRFVTLKVVLTFRILRWPRGRTELWLSAVIKQSLRREGDSSNCWSHLCSRWSPVIRVALCRVHTSTWAQQSPLWCGRITGWLKETHRYSRAEMKQLARLVAKVTANSG